MAREIPPKSGGGALQVWCKENPPSQKRPKLTLQVCCKCKFKMRFFAKTYTVSLVQVQVFSIKYAQNLHLQLKFDAKINLQQTYTVSLLQVQV